jgi:hypothetical protein
MASPAEVWKNEAAGMRWVKVTDRQGKDGSRNVQPGKVFTITPFDRQINQDSFATPEQDLFRNGTFVLVKPADDTIIDEIESPDSLTESEVQGIVYEILAKKVTGEQAIRNINSPIALNRILTALVLEEDAPNSAVAAVKAKHVKMEGGTPVATERVVVAPAPEPEKVETPRGGIPTVDTPDFVQTEPEKVG